MSEAPLELWKGVKGKYFRGLSLKELEAQSKNNRTEQWITDIILSGHTQPFQNYYATPLDMITGESKIYPYSKEVISGIFEQRHESTQNEREKDFYKVFEQLSINKSRV